VAPETVSRSVPEGKIDWRTAAELVSKIKEKPKQVEIAKALVQKRVRGTAARKIIQEVARSPQKPVEDAVRKIVEAPPQVPFMPEHVLPIRKGIKIQTSRKGLDPKIRIGARVEAYTKFAELRVEDISRKRLGDFTEEDAKREGGYTLEEFKKVWRKLHGKWNPEETVNVVRFKVERMTI
jgi:uncharacterized protein YqfB (UPF0267 family)